MSWLLSKDRLPWLLSSLEVTKARLALYNIIFPPFIFDSFCLYRSNSSVLQCYEIEISRWYFLSRAIQRISANQIPPIEGRPRDSGRSPKNGLVPLWLLLKLWVRFASSSFILDGDVVRKLVLG